MRERAQRAITAGPRAAAQFVDENAAEAAAPGVFAHDERPDLRDAGIERGQFAASQQDAVAAHHHREARRARAARYRTLCAFTHDPRFFVRFGFSIVPHTWLPEKVAADCWSCPHFQKCGQYAVVDTRLGRAMAPAPAREHLS